MNEPNEEPRESAFRRCWSMADARMARRYAFTCLAWAVSYWLAIEAISEGWVTSTAARWAVGALPTLVGVVLVVAFIRFLGRLDELQRRIQVEALAFAFGAGFLFMTGYRICERLGAPRLDVDDPLLPMIVAWVVATWLVTRRYA